MVLLMLGFDMALDLTVGHRNTYLALKVQIINPHQLLLYHGYGASEILHYATLFIYLLWAYSNISLTDKVLIGVHALVSEVYWISIS